MKKLAIALMLFCSVGCFAKSTKAHDTKHTIKATARPYKIIGHYTKKAAVCVGETAWVAIDAAIVDPIGVGFQVVADGLDMYVAAPLEAMPEPFETLGDGVHVLYDGLDALGQQLAK